MTRTTAREIAIHFAYELGFSNESAEALLSQMLTPDTFASIAQVEPLYAEFPDEAQEAYIRKVVTGVAAHGYELDGYIEKYAVGWRFNRIPRTAAAILRVAMYELMYMPEIPNKVAINEAVEIAKGYEEPQVVSFLNGILGSFSRQELGGL